MQKRFAWFLLGGLVWGLSGCDQPAEDLRAWTVDDHDHQAEVKERRRTKPRTHRAPSDKDQLAEVTWMNQCAKCHGKRGRADGPQSPMVKAKDLSDPAWQAMVSDEAMAKVIQTGRDKMPAFDLPESTIKGLVKHVRRLARRSRPQDQPPEQEAEAAGASGKPSQRMPPH
jgi:cytochrome c553